MPRLMADSVTSADIPTDYPMVAGYVDGLYRWSDEDWARHAGKTLVRIACFSGTDDGHVLDIEPGNSPPVEAPGWVTKRRAAGIVPTIYCSLSWQGPILREFRRQGVADPLFWLANWTGVPHDLPGAVATQYAHPTQTGGHFDLSSVPGRWPSVDTDPAPAPPTPTPDVPGTHTVRPGDTLSGIAAQHGIAWQALYAANRALVGPDPNVIRPGQVLVIPSGQPATRYYMVRPGDTLSGIAALYGIGWQSLYAANRDVVGPDPNMIRPGQLLTVPGG